MPKIKMKTSRSARKRFTLTGTGRVRRKKSLHNHILTKKSTKRKRHLRQRAYIDPSFEKSIKRLLPYG